MYIEGALLSKSCNSIIQINLSQFLFLTYRYIQCSQPHINNLIALGCIIALICVILLGLDGQYVEEHQFASVCHVSILYYRYSTLNHIEVLLLQSTPVQQSFVHFWGRSPRCVIGWSLLSITKYFGNAKHNCWLPGLQVCCKYACFVRAFSSVFRYYCAIQNGTVTSTCVLHWQRFLGS